MQICRGARRLRTIWLVALTAYILTGCGQLRQSTSPQSAKHADHLVDATRSHADEKVEQTARTPTPEEQIRIQRLEHRFTQAVSAGKGMEEAAEKLGESDPSAFPPVAESVSPPDASGTPPPESPAASDAVAGESFVPTDLTDARQNLAKVKEIVERAEKFYSENPKFTCRITRKERVGGKVLPQETMAMNFRLQPRSVYYKWLDESNQGREMVYVDGKNDGKIITLGGRNDFLMTGKRIKVDPTGFLAKKNGRYPISDSGNDKMIERLKGQIANQEKGIYTHGVLKYQGTVQRKENFGPMDYFVHEIPKGFDHAFPDGGVRHWYFDQKTSRLVLLHAEDPKGEFLEYYLFDRFLPNPALEDRDFDPDYLWPKKTASNEADKGPLRIAGGAENPPK